MLIVAVATTFATHAFAQSPRFGHFNSGEFIQNMPEVKEVMKTIEGETATIESQLTILQEDLNKMAQEYERDAANLSQEARAEREEELMMVQQKIQNFVATSRQQLESRQRELMAPIMQKVLRAVQEVGAENGYLYIFDDQSGITLYMSERSEDVAPLIKQKLGI